jgi:hypothetical protein
MPLLLLLGGCAANGSMPEHSKTTLSPERSVEQLLMDRMRICELPPEDSEALYTASLNRKTRPHSQAVDEEKLDALLLATCKPAQTPGIFRQLLTDLTRQGTWPPDYAALFELLAANQKAYAVIEGMYVKLQQDHQQTIQEHEQTIKGLSEIETQIDDSAPPIHKIKSHELN